MSCFFHINKQNQSHALSIFKQNKNKTKHKKIRVKMIEIDIPVELIQTKKKI